MTVEEMHYRFKLKLNKIDSQQKVNLNIPEIDVYLNEAQLLLIKMIVESRTLNGFGFESTTRTIDDIKNIVVEKKELDKIESNLFEFPEDYLHKVKLYGLVENKECGEKEIKVYVQQHDDEFDREFYKSDYYWNRLNVVINEKGIETKPIDFEVKKLYLTYVREPEYIHFAEGFSQDGYKLNENVLLQGKQNCELFKTIHPEIVDLAVLLVQENLQSQTNMIKLKLNNLLKN